MRYNDIYLPYITSQKRRFSTLRKGLGIPHQEAVYSAERRGISPVDWYKEQVNTYNPDVWYNWLPYAGQDEPIETYKQMLDIPGWIPMCWAPKGRLLERSVEIAKNHPSLFWLVGNELERSDQGDMSPLETKDAFQYWTRTTNSTNGFPGLSWGEQAKEWLTEYIEIGGEIPDYWTFHIYGPSDGPGWRWAYKSIETFLRDFDVLAPIMITETCAWSGLLRDQVEVMQESLRLVDSERWLEGVWWFTYRYNAGIYKTWNSMWLSDLDDNVLPLGEQYRSL